MNYKGKIPGCENFTWEEVFHTSHDAALNRAEFLGLPEDELLQITFNIIAVANRLQAARDFLGFPIPIQSWYRSPRVESLVGGSGANHPKGGAVDPKLSGRKLQQFIAFFRKHTGGLGSGSYQAHMDVFKKRRWSYNKRG